MKPDSAERFAGIPAHVNYDLIPDVVDTEPELAKEFRASAEDLARTCHAHPILAEVVREAALAVDKRALTVASAKARRRKGIAKTSQL